MKLPVALDEDILQYGYRQYVYWDYEKEPHLAIFGGTGSGKTFLLLLLLGRIGLYLKDVTMIICDFKGDTDFDFLNGCKTFFRFDECSKGTELAISVLEHRQKERVQKTPVFFVFDEWSAFINSLDKKKAEQQKQMLARILMLGRSMNIHLILSQQRLDANYFASGRDNFSAIIGLGRLSKESINMLMNDFKEEIEPVKGRGHGSAILGNELSNIYVPAVTSINKLHNSIYSLCCQIDNHLTL